MDGQPARRNLRDEIAYRAARLIAEDGITDFAAAKQKAARQIGVTEKGSLPDNREIEVALKSFQSLFQRDSQPRQCRLLRQVAVDAMRWLDRFSPWLVGAVLTGAANRFSKIELEIIADDAKQLEMFFLNEHTKFETRLAQVRQSKREDALNEISIYELLFDETPVAIFFYPHHSARMAHHRRASLREARAQLADVELLVSS
jgi:hypothetical protein